MAEYINNPVAPSREDALHSIATGAAHPYDGTAGEATDWAHVAARGILANLSDRRGIRHELEACDDDVREEIAATIAEIIRATQPS